MKYISCDVATVARRIARSGYDQRVIAAFYNVENVPGFHLRAHAFEQIERTKRIARALDKEDRRAQSAQNFVAKFCAIAHRAERISKANDRVYFLLQRNVTSDPPAHALADQNRRAIVNRSTLGERFAVRGNQLRQTIGPLPPFAHVGIIKKRHATDCGQAIFPALHPWMGGGRACSGSEKEKRFHALEALRISRSRTANASPRLFPKTTTPPS